MAERGMLADRLEAATGPDAALDGALAETFDLRPAAYTSSAEAARDLVRAVLPGWHLHVGFDAGGVLPYAALSKDAAHEEAMASTVPLAILRVAFKAIK